jgi:hypothetical protein
LPESYRVLYNRRSTRWELWAEAVACAVVSPCVLSIHAPELLEAITRLFAETELAQRARRARAA